MDIGRGEEHQRATAALLTLYLGLREHEVLGLRARDIDDAGAGYGSPSGWPSPDLDSRHIGCERATACPASRVRS